MSDDADSKILGVLASLDEEQAQEKRVAGDQGSPFETAPAEDVWIERAREYDDPTKHWVRRQSWLKVLKKIRDKKGAGLRVLTLPGRYRLEVELYRREDVIDDGNVLDVVAFESSPEVFGLLDSMKPRFERLFLGDVVKVLGRETSAEYKDLKATFPFDAINLDLTVNLITKADAPYAPVLKALRECIRLQASQDGRWALMLTFRWDPSTPFNAEALAALRDEFEANLRSHPQVRDACSARHQCATAEAFFSKNPEEAIGRFTAKWIVDQAHAAEWHVVQCEQLRYERQWAKGTYVIRKIVFTFERGSINPHDVPAKTVPVQTWQVDDLVNVVGGGETRDVQQRFEKMAVAEQQAICEELESMRAAADQVA